MINMREGSVYQRIEIYAPHVECYGKNESEGYNYLATLSENTYWHPDYPFFPFIDAVVMCQAFQSGDNHPETIIAYIQVTIRNEKTFKPNRLLELNNTLDTNSNLKDFKRVFVVVGPDPMVCEIFTLHNAPDPTQFQTMVGCFVK